MCVCGWGERGRRRGSKYPTMNRSSTTSVQPRMHRAALATRCALCTTQTFCSFFKHSLMYNVRYIKTRSAAPCRLEGREKHASFSTGQITISICSINITVPLNCKVYIFVPHTPFFLLRSLDMMLIKLAYDCVCVLAAVDVSESKQETVTYTKAITPAVP